MRVDRHDAGLLLVSLIWGANYVVAKLVVGHTSPVIYAALRFGVSTGVLWLLVWRSVRPAALPPRTARVLAAWGIVGHTLNQLALLYGLKYTSPTNSALIFATLPVVVAVLGIWFGLERPSPRVWAGIGLGTVGVAIVVGARGSHFEGATRLGDLLIVVSLIAWALFTIGVRKAAVGVNPIHASAITHLGGTPGLAIAAIPVAVHSGGVAWGPTLWFGVAYASLLSSVVASVLWTRGLTALGGNRTALFNCVTPIFTALASWLVLGERPLPVQAAGTALVIVGVLVSRHPGEAEEP